MRYLVYTSQCTCPTICSSACDWRPVTDDGLPRGRALALAAELTIGFWGSWERARVFAVGQTTGRLIAEFRQQGPS